MNSGEIKEIHFFFLQDGGLQRLNFLAGNEKD